MSTSRRIIRFEGLLENNVLGTFTVIRGFANLGDLAEVSVPIFHDSISRTGYQRQTEKQHIDDIKIFLSKGRYRFFPEIVLGLWSKGESDSVVSYKKKRPKTEHDQAFTVSVNLERIKADAKGRIHRIDGNHRLEAAKLLLEEQKTGATFKDFTKAPFCFVIMDSDKPADDDLAEAMLFNLINSKALAIASEHSLSVLMSDSGTPGERFFEDPQVYLTRWIHDKVKGWPHGFYDSMGKTPLTRLHSASGVLLRPPDGIPRATEAEMVSAADKLFGPLYELAIRLQPQHKQFVHSYAFLPIATEVYSRHSTIDPAKGANTEEERLVRAERWLGDFALWFERVGGVSMPAPADPVVLWTVFKRDYDKRAGKVFIAMSFSEEKSLKEVEQAIDEAIDLYNKDHENCPLSPKRADRQKGKSFEIPAWIFSEIGQSRLMIADLTDEKPNVYCEVGYAKSRGIPFILTYRKSKKSDKPPWDRKSGGNKVHFDLAAYRYIAYETGLELRGLLKNELDAWAKNED